MLWKKDTDVAGWVTRFTVGDDYKWDTLLLPYDIEGTRAHAAGLVEIEILSADELQQIEGALHEMVRQVEAKNIVVRQEDEDCHTVIESFLTERLGDIGKKIHTGRSRNDQVLTALRLFIREKMTEIMHHVGAVCGAFCDLGERNASIVMPGYTHFQRAMPTTAGLWAMGYAELMLSDLQALIDAYDQINTSPLGSAAGYGVPYLKLPRKKNTERLEFSNQQSHVTAVQLSRGKLELHAVHALVQVAATFNRLASDLILFNTSEYGFVELPAEFCTGSSIMPQKKNPDVLELVRANYHRLIAEMQVLLTLPANLPSGYHRDLQLTKEAVMRSLLLTEDLVTATLNLLPGLRFNEEKMKAALSPELFATSRALDKVLAGMPFREAYRQAAAEIDPNENIDVEAELAAYKVEGFPGKINPDGVRKELSARMHNL